MKKVVRVTTFAKQERDNSWLRYWLSRPPDERVAEVDRLRAEYLKIRGQDALGTSEGLRGSFRIIRRKRR